MPKQKSSKSSRVRVAINGFGRIGRAAFKIALEKRSIEIVAINDLTDAKMLAHLLQYDTVYGKYPKAITCHGSIIKVGRQSFNILAQPDPKKLPWKKLKVDVVLECTGRFVKDGAARAHLRAGAGNVVLSSPAKGSGDVKTFVKGVNTGEYKNQKVISNSSCTTNCVAPVVAIMEAFFGIENAMMTTIHSYTASQNLQDGPHKDMRRARAGAMNIIPTTTGSARDTSKAIPVLDGHFDAIAVRIPTVLGSLSDFTFAVKKKTTVDKVNAAFKKAARMPLYKDVMMVTDEPIVSSDIIGNPCSSIVDLGMTRVTGGTMVKIISWYDNEWGYSNRLVDMIGLVA